MKVYCKDCFYHFIMVRDPWGLIVSSDNEVDCCAHFFIVIQDAMKEDSVPAPCRDINKLNDCSCYRKQRKWWHFFAPKGE